MRFSVLLMIATELCLSACAVQMVDGARVYGHLQSVSIGDIRAAMAADKADTGNLFRDRIYEIDVISRDEMHMYHSRRENGLWNHAIIQRIDGKWESVGGIAITS
jgi:hypothetical protein